MRDALVQRVRNVLRRVSVDIMKFDAGTHPLARRMRLYQEHGIDQVLDVGANVGQFASELRDLGYRGWIISYEPLSSAFSVLERRAARDERWKVVNAGMGATAGKATINIAGNSQSSSLLPMLDAHVRAAPQSAYVGTEEIRLETLAAALDEHATPGRRTLVKIDAQGLERQILDSGGVAFDRVVGAQLEMSLTPLYEGELLIAPMIEYMTSRGLALMSIEPGYADPASGRLLQADGIFFRTQNSDA
jgi:FkbM family methyltransferase